MIKLLQFILVFICLSSTNAQRMFRVSIQIPAAMEGKSFMITYDDGLSQSIPVTDTFTHKRLNFSGNFYSTFAVLKISHVASDSIVHYDEYFIGTNPAEIVFSDSATMLTDGHFKYDRLTNVVEILQSKIKKQRDAFVKTEMDEMNRLFDENGNSVYRKDSLLKLFYKNANKINNKDIEFVKKNANEYFSFWWFRTQILPNTSMDGNTNVREFENLLNVYNKVFPSDFKSTAEGKKMEELLIGRINARINYAAPNFEMKDINGNNIRLRDFKDKYILFDFWATWCGPCVREIPFIKKIRDDYPENKLAIISVSGDYDINEFKSMIKEKDMNWIHIYGDKTMPIKFGVTAYPTIFLIDKNGTIIFDGKGKDKDDLIALLKRMQI